MKRSFALISLGLLAATPARAISTFDFGTYGSYGSAVSGGVDNASCQYPQGSFNFVTDGSCYFSQQSVAAASGSQSDSLSGSTSSAQAFLDGTLSAAVTGTTFIPYVGTASAYAHALVWDTLVFSGAATGATATITVSGTASLSGDARMGTLALLEDPSQTGPIVSPPSQLEGNYSTLLTTTGGYSVSTTFAITNGTPMLFEVGLALAAGVSGASAPPFPPEGITSIDATYTLTLPTGVTVTSDAGASVPEPSGLPVLGAGLLLLGATRLVRRARRLTPTSVAAVL